MSRPLLDTLGRPLIDSSGRPALEGCEPDCCGDPFEPGDCAECEDCPTSYAVSISAVYDRFRAGDLNHWEYEINLAVVMDRVEIPGIPPVTPCAPNEVDSGDWDATLVFDTGSCVFDGSIDTGTVGFIGAFAINCDDPPVADEYAVMCSSCTATLTISHLAEDIVDALMWDGPYFLLSVAIGLDTDDSCLVAHMPAGEEGVIAAAFVARVPVSGCLTDAEWVPYPVVLPNSGTDNTCVPRSGSVSVS